MNRNLLNFIAVLAVLFVITACVCQSDRNTPVQISQSNSTPVTEQTIESNTSTDNSKNEDKGDFIVEHSSVKNARYEEIDRQIKEEKLLENAASKLNGSLILPNDIFLRSKDCGEINAFYDPRDQSVTVCYELMEHYYKSFKSIGDTDQKAYDKMFDAVRFAFLHEIGHALIDNYKLPIMGNEEDAADRCSAYINLEELGEDGVRAVLAAADSFAIESKRRTPDSRSMADEHLLNEQRFYNSLCMIYGSNPTKYSNISGNYLPKERAVRCPSEYQRTVDSWVDLLREWRKD